MLLRRRLTKLASDGSAEEASAGRANSALPPAPETPQDGVESMHDRQRAAVVHRTRQVHLSGDDEEEVAGQHVVLRVRKWHEPTESR